MKRQCIYLILLSQLLLGCESTNEAISQKPLKSGLLIEHMNPALPDLPVSFYLHDTISTGLPHQYRWTIQGQTEPTVSEHPLFHHTFADEGTSTVTVEVFDEKLNQIGQGSSQIVVKDLLGQFRIRIEKRDAITDDFILMRPAPLETVRATWNSGLTYSDTLTRTITKPGKYSAEVRLDYGNLHGIRTLDTTLHVTATGATPPPLDLFQDCRVILSFTGDHFPYYWRPDENIKRLTYSIETETVDTGKFGRTATTYFHSNEWGDRTDRNNEVGFDSLSWQLSADAGVLLQWRFHKEKHVNSGSGNGRHLIHQARVFDADLLWANADTAVYFSEGPQLEQTLDFN